MEVLVQIWPIIAFMIGQTGAAIWWAASVSANLSHMKEDISDIKDDAHSAVVEAKSEIKALHKRIDFFTSRVGNGRS